MTKRGAIRVGALMCLGAIAFFGYCWVVYSMRFTYVRAVHDAARFGKDPYELARNGVQGLADDFMVPVTSLAAAAFLLGLLVLSKSMNRDGAEPPINSN